MASTRGKEHVPPMLKLAVFLHYLRSNAFYRNCSTQHFIQLSRSSVSRIVNGVAKIIASGMPTYVKFPTIEEQDEIASRIFSSSGLPGVIGKLKLDSFGL